MVGKLGPPFRVPLSQNERHTSSSGKWLAHPYLPLNGSCRERLHAWYYLQYVMRLYGVCGRERLDRKQVCVGEPTKAKPGGH